MNCIILHEFGYLGTWFFLLAVSAIESFWILLSVLTLDFQNATDKEQKH